MLYSLRCVGLLGLASLLAAADRHSISGVVEADGQAIAGATVRVQATGIVTHSNIRGEFTLDGLPTSRKLGLTAFAQGYYIAGPVPASAGSGPVRIVLKRHAATDNPSYQWISPFSSTGNPSSCQNCHADSARRPRLPFDEWKVDAHGQSARNPRFLSMYRGTDISGRRRSPPTRFTVDREYGRIPLAPDPNSPYFGPGFKLDFPDAAGNCAACHQPEAAVRAPYTTDASTSPDSFPGIGCDLCHKVWNVRLDPSKGRPYPNTPGVLSFEFRRPPTGEDLFLGPFDDVAPRDDTYSSLQQKSQFCAPCHFGEFWGVQIYNSFGEWLDSPYSASGGQTCQDCHMPQRGSDHFAAIAKGGHRRSPDTIFSHLMRGAADPDLLREAAELGVTALREGAVIRVVASVTNARAGHSLPTDHPSRNILLIVAATDSSGRDLPLVKGSVMPDWGGKGTTAADYAGRPGKGFAKVLEQQWTGVYPSVAYWTPAKIKEDNRIPALATDTSSYEFQAPGAGPVTVVVKLLYRRAFRELAKSKEWPDRDVIMREACLTMGTKGTKVCKSRV